MPLPTPYQEYIALSKYARWREEDNRRETWEETVDRYIEFLVSTVESGEEIDE
jgi:ribonucleoside-triphosphate reductase